MLRANERRNQIAMAQRLTIWWFRLLTLVIICACTIEGRRDPYRVLGVNKNASQDEIKQAYRKLCLKYHPDKNRSSPKRDEFESVFKDVQQAYEHIGTAKARREFDATSPFSKRNQGFGGTSDTQRHQKTYEGRYYSDRNGFFSQSSTGKQQGAATTFEDLMRAYEEMFDEVRFGDFSRSFQKADFSGLEGKQSIFRKTVKVPLEELYRGNGHFEFHLPKPRPWACLVAAFRGGNGPIYLYRSLIYAAPFYKVSKWIAAAVAVYFFYRFLPKPSSQRFWEQIPPGCKSGNSFVFQDDSDSSVQYHFEVLPLQNRRFRLEGSDSLWTTFTISPENARRGCVVQLKGILGNTFNVKFPARVKDGQVLTVPNHGWPIGSKSSSQTNGNLKINVRISSKRQGQSC